MKTGSEPFTVNLNTNSASLLAKFYDSTGVNVITSLTFSAGANQASFEYFDTVAGSPKLSVAGSGLSVSQIETVKAGATAKMVFVSLPSSVPSGQAFTVVVKCLDQYSNVVPGAVVSLALSGGPSLSLTPTAKTNAEGEAGFSVSIAKLGTDYFTATVGKIKQQSASFSIVANPGTPRSLIRP